MMKIEATELFDFLGDVRFAAFNAQKRNADIARQYGQIMQFNVRMYASGYPGPEVVTGRYRSSISLDFSAVGDNASSEVYTMEPRGYRLEYGFHGVDSIGREQNSAPFPHFGPALQMTVPVWEEALAGAMHRAIHKGMY